MVQFINMLSHPGTVATHQWLKNLGSCQPWSCGDDASSQTEFDWCRAANQMIQHQSCASLWAYLLWHSKGSDDPSWWPTQRPGGFSTSASVLDPGWQDWKCGTLTLALGFASTSDRVPTLSSRSSCNTWVPLYPSFPNWSECPADLQHPTWRLATLVLMEEIAALKEGWRIAFFLHRSLPSSTPPHPQSSKNFQPSLFPTHLSAPWSILSLSPTLSDLCLWKLWPSTSH